MTCSLAFVDLLNLGSNIPLSPLLLQQVYVVVHVLTRNTIASRRYSARHLSRR